MRDLDQVSGASAISQFVKVNNGMAVCLDATARALGIDLTQDVRGDGVLSPENLARLPEAARNLTYQLDKRDGRLGLYRQREAQDGSYAGLR